MDSKDKKRISFKGIFTEADRIQINTRIYTKDLWKYVEDNEDNEDWEKECGLDPKEKTE